MALLSSSSVAMNIPRRGRLFLLSNLYPKNNRAPISSIGQNSSKRNIHSDALLTVDNSHHRHRHHQFFRSATNNINLHHMNIPSIITENISNQLVEMWNNLSTWFIKRTYQPSIIRKRRKTGFLSRQKTVGGRRILKRRRNKGRMRLGGC